MSAVSAFMCLNETQQLSYVAVATPICYLCELIRHGRQPMTGRLATHPSSTAVKIGLQKILELRNTLSSLSYAISSVDMSGKAASDSTNNST